MIDRRLAALVVAGSLLALAACGAAGAPEPSAGSVPKLQVIATFSVLGDLVASVGGESIDLRVLVGPGTDAHAYRPAPTDSRALLAADVVFEQGLGFESGWFDDLYAGSGARAPRVVASADIVPLRTAAGAPDPHTWHDVRLAQQSVRTIRDALRSANPSGASGYEARAEKFLAKLQDLDQWVRDEVARLPRARRILVTGHDVLAYFARRYGFTVLGSAVGGASTAAVEPSAATIARLVEQLRAHAVPVVFAEQTADARLVRAIADETGARVARLHTDTLTDATGSAPTYVAMIRSNVNTIVRGLRG